MLKQRIKYLLLVGAGGLIGLLSLARISQAETVIVGEVQGLVVWEEAYSPYVVEDSVYISKGSSLVIKPGVTVIAGDSLEGTSVFYVDGNLYLEGSNSKRITISGISNINVSGGKVDMSYADIRLSEGISVFDGYAHISSSTISGARNGIVAKSSTISVNSSEIKNNKYGIVIENSIDDIFYPVFKGDLYGEMGGIGNAFETENPSASVVTIRQSSITDNTEAGIENSDHSYVEATNNWWGSESGPQMFGQNRISGLINYTPWLPDNPLDLPLTVCCSSVLFIPGLEGTRLYKEEIMPVLGKVTNRLWEPNRNKDVEKLYMDETGSSIDLSIYSEDLVNKALGLKDIYGKFISYLDEKKNKDEINDWKFFGYDWRKPITEVVAGTEKRATTTESILETVKELASKSKTGKVNIIAHSNGGLVAKYLVKVLSDIGQSDIIESVISVAVPYLGTPQAIASLLHGSNQTILGGIILSQSTARTLAKNMPSAYALLPSGKYFSQIVAPTIAFASTTVKNINDGSYPKNISSFEDQSDFITDSKNVRTEPLSSDVSMPIKGNSQVALATDFIHDMLDYFPWPASIKSWSVLGWGINTVKKIVYSEKAECAKSGCDISPIFKTEKSVMGDGTVIAPSAVYDVENKVSLNLEDLSKQEKRNIEHSNILGASSTIRSIDQIIGRSDEDGKILEEISKIPGATIGEPDYSREPVSLVLSTHSPVELHVYDSYGNHTGLIPKPEGLADVEDGLYTFVETEIIGSTFDRYEDGEGGSDSYIYLPDDDGQKYTVLIKGTDFGQFGYEIERVRGGEILDNVKYNLLPTSPFTVATTTIQARTSESDKIVSLSADSPMIRLDIDGDGVSDMNATSTTEISPAVISNSLRSIVTNLGLNNKLGKELLKKIDKLDSLIKKGKIDKIDHFVEKLKVKISHKKYGALSQKERELILGGIDLYVSGLI